MRITKTDVTRAIDAAMGAFVESLNDTLRERFNDQDQKRQQNLPIAIVERTPMQEAAGVYIMACRQRYGQTMRPDLGGKAQGVLKRILKDHGPEATHQILTTYLIMEDPWFLGKKHDLVTLDSQLQKVLVAMTVGGATEGVSNLKLAAQAAGVTL